jgi:hypothetical protein
MKPIFFTLLAVIVCSPVFADIQAPPASDYGATRKLGRGLGNIAFGLTEIPFQMSVINDLDGSYYPPYRSDIPWINSGYSEFPPELGFETRYDYSRLSSNL